MGLNPVQLNNDFLTLGQMVAAAVMEVGGEVQEGTAPPSAQERQLQKDADRLKEMLGI